MQSAVAPMGAWVAQGKWAIVDTARSDIGRLITFNHKVLYCSETHSNSPSIEQVHWPENAFLPLHHRNFLEREFKSQRRARRRQKMHGNDHVASVGLQGLNMVLRQNHGQPRERSTPVRRIIFTPILASVCSMRPEHTRACLALASWTPRRPGSILTRTESGGDPVPSRGYLRSRPERPRRLTRSWGRWRYKPSSRIVACVSVTSAISWCDCPASTWRAVSTSEGKTPIFCSSAASGSRPLARPRENAPPYPSCRRS